MHCSRCVVPGIAVLALGAAAFTLAGCNIYRQGGSLRSNDTFTYIADEHYPVTVTLMDTRTNEPVWTADVPVGKQLTIRFHEAQYPDNPANPDAMRWRFFDKPTRAGELGSVMAVPNKFSRRIDTSIRSSPEYPAGTDPRGQSLTVAKPMPTAPSTTDAAMSVPSITTPAPTPK
ncbi:MAG: hypothetical protein K2Y21_07530 [Phycisphaerales bacterium]|nr:hypothetical protein [Phycisphaerales bacterium]